MLKLAAFGTDPAHMGTDTRMAIRDPRVRLFLLP